MFQVGEYLINPGNILYCRLNLEESRPQEKRLKGMVIHFVNGTQMELDEEPAGQFWNRLKILLMPQPQVVEVPSHLLRHGH